MTTSSKNADDVTFPPGERGELLRALAEQRELLLITVRGLTDAQAARRTTASELTLGGIVKHMARGEQAWRHILVERDGELPDGMLDMEQYRMAEGESLPELLNRYAAAARELDAAVTGLRGADSMDATVPRPRTPWSPPETVHWPVRRILLYLIRETAQHAGHADIVREALDGANSTAQR